MLLYILPCAQPVRKPCSISPEAMLNLPGGDAQSGAEYSADELWKEYKLKIIQKYRTKREKTVTDMRNSEIVVDELKEQVESNEAIIELSKRIQDDEQRLLIFRYYDKRIDEKSEELNKIISDLVQTFKRYDDIQERYEQVSMAKEAV